MVRRNVVEWTFYRHFIDFECDIMIKTEKGKSIVVKAAMLFYLVEYG